MVEGGCWNSIIPACRNRDNQRPCTAAMFFESSCVAEMDNALDISNRGTRFAVAVVALLEISQAKRCQPNEGLIEGSSPSTGTKELREEKDMGYVLKVAGSVYNVWGKFGDEQLCFADNFVACDAEVAIEKAKNWVVLKRPDANHSKTVIVDVRCLAQNVIE